MDVQIKYSPKIKPTEEMLRSRREQVRRMYPHARIFELEGIEPILKTEENINKAEDVPLTITLITPNSNDMSQDQLYVGHQPIARKNWIYDPTTETLKFRQGFGESFLGGEFRMVRDRTSGYGTLQIGKTAFAIEIHVKSITYDMKLAKDAAYVAGTSIAPQLRYDPNSDNWKAAKWSEANMRMTYGIERSGSIAGQPVYFIKCKFQDTVTGETWEPDEGSYLAYMSADMILSFNLNEGWTPMPDSSNPFQEFISKRFPFIFKAQMDAFAQNYYGAMLCDERSLQGSVYGVQGIYDGTAVNGMYSLIHSSMPSGTDRHLVAVHNGWLVIDQQIVEGSRKIGNRLEWSELPPPSGCQYRSTGIWLPTVL